MKLNYIKSQSSVKPDLVDTTSSKTTVYIRQNIIEKEKIVENTNSEDNDTTSSKTTVYVRQNIVEKEKAVENTNSEDNDAISTTVFYEYDEAKLTKEEYQEYLKELEIIDIQQQRADIDYIMLMTGLAEE